MERGREDAIGMHGSGTAGEWQEYPLHEQGTGTFTYYKDPLGHQKGTAKYRLF